MRLLLPSVKCQKRRRDSEGGQRIRRLKTGNERQGGVSDHWGQMQPMFGGGGGLDTCLVEEETLDFATGSSWRPPFGLAPESAVCPSFL